ncbi:hypothetical protein I3W98_15000, partial [Streptomyces cavourensis]|nr:hypothetical protein [Streptomyces cavourensis]
MTALVGVGPVAYGEVIRQARLPRCAPRPRVMEVASRNLTRVTLELG